MITYHGRLLNYGHDGTIQQTSVMIALIFLYVHHLQVHLPKCESKKSQAQLIIRILTA